MPTADFCSASSPPPLRPPAAPAPLARFLPPMISQCWPTAPPVRPVPSRPAPATPFLPSPPPGAPAPEARVGRGHTQNPYDRVAADLESQIAQARSNIVHIKAQKLHPDIEDMVVQTYEQHIEVAERDMEIAQHKRAFFAAGKPTVMRQYTELRDMYDEVGLSQPTPMLATHTRPRARP